MKFTGSPPEKNIEAGNQILTKKKRNNSIYLRKLAYQNFKSPPFAMNQTWSTMTSIVLNIAVRLPENSRNSFVDLQSNSKTEQKIVFSLKAEMLSYD